VPASAVRTVAEVPTCDDADFRSAGVWAEPPAGIDDLQRMVAMPFSANCSSEHGPRVRAPHLGEHTESFFAKGWSPRVHEAELPKKGSGEATSSPLEGVTVVEISDSGTIASAACSMMADMGATVIKVETTPGGDMWRTRDERFFVQLNRGKRCVELSLSSKPDCKWLLATLASAQLLVSNLPTSLLQGLGLGRDYQKKHPELAHLVVVHVTPFGGDGDEQARGDLGSWWGSSGFASMLSGAPPARPKTLPTQHGELGCSFNVLAGALSGLFHQKRTGEGQLIEVNLLLSGMWAMMQTVTMLIKDPKKISLAQMKPEEFHSKFPVATANSFRTKDGVWVQFLGVDIKRHLMKTLGALGVKYTTLAKVLWAVVTEVLPNTSAPTLLDRIPPVFVRLNGALKRRVGELTWLECKALFERHDVWHCRVNMPKDALGSVQARECGTFIGDPLAGPCLIANPMQLSNCQHKPSTTLPPLMSTKDF